MKGKSVFGFSRTMLVQSPVSLATVTVAALLLSIMIQNDPAVAADGCPAPSFAAPVVYNAVYNSYSLVVGDFNGDGKLDLAVANSSSTDISVLLGNGDGTFQPATSYGAGVGPWAVVGGDFNGDGEPGGVAVLLGRGDGSFQLAGGYATGPYPQSIAVRDLNGDGKLDVAVAAGSGAISVLLGKGDGSFEPAFNYNANASSQSVAVGDFNGDGKLDLVLPNNS